MTHEEARDKAIREMLEQNPDIQEIIHQSLREGWPFRQGFKVVQERLGLEKLCTLSLATNNENCRATHPETGGECTERHPHTGPHMYRVRWFDQDEG